MEDMRGELAFESNKRFEQRKWGWGGKICFLPCFFKHQCPVGIAVDELKVDVYFQAPNMHSKIQHKLVRLAVSLRTSWNISGWGEF